MVEKVLFDSLNYFSEERKEEYEDEFGGEYDPYAEMECDFEIFNNEYSGQRYVVVGTVGRWDGNYNGHHPQVFHSIAEAINGAMESYSMCYIKVVEESYGSLKLYISHHDGHDNLEIRELSSLGDEIYQNEYCVTDILQRKGATRNVKFLRRYH